MSLFTTLAKAVSFLRSPEGFITSKVFRAVRRLYVSAATKAGQRLSEVGSNLQAVGMGSKTMGYHGDVVQYKLFLDRIPAVQAFPWNKPIDYSILSNVELKRPAKYRFFLTAKVTENGMPVEGRRNYSFYSNDISTLQQASNDFLTGMYETMQKYDLQFEDIQFIGVQQNTLLLEDQ